MPECNEYDTEICRFRGDTQPLKFQVTQSGSPSTIDITGYSFLFTVNSERNPDIDVSPEVGTQQFQITGTITTAVEGRFEFRYEASPNPSELIPGTYYYDIQMTESGGNVRTIGKGKYVIKQDITK